MWDASDLRKKRDASLGDAKPSGGRSTYELQWPRSWGLSGTSAQINLQNTKLCTSVSGERQSTARTARPNMVLLIDPRQGVQGAASASTLSIFE